MNYLHQCQEISTFPSLDLKELPFFILQQTNTEPSGESSQKMSFKNPSTPQTKYSHPNHLRPLIKINRNLENAFPQNFFSKSNFPPPFKGKKHQPTTDKYQSIEIRMSTPIECSQFKQNLEQPHQKRFKIKSLKSSRTSIQRKHEITFFFQKEKPNQLPQTAQTLENFDSEELFNVTFGNPFSKPSTPKISSIQIQFSQNYLDKMEKGNLKNSNRLKNAVSLELKRNVERTQKKKSLEKKETGSRILCSQRSGSMSERRHLVYTLNERREMNLARGNHENPFVKIKLDMEQILRKKTLVLPKLSNDGVNTRKRQRLSKLVNLFS